MAVWKCLWALKSQTSPNLARTAQYKENSVKNQFQELNLLKSQFLKDRSMIITTYYIIIIPRLKYQWIPSNRFSAKSEREKMTLCNAIIKVSTECRMPKCLYLFAYVLTLKQAVKKLKRKKKTFTSRNLQVYYKCTCMFTKWIWQLNLRLR